MEDWVFTPSRAASTTIEFPSTIHGERIAIMSAILDEILSANRSYAAQFGDRSRLPMPPARRFAILTCMDARLDPASDAIRSLVISYKLLGTREWLVIHHTHCGMETFTSDVMNDLLRSSLKPATLANGKWKDEGGGPGSREGEYINWLTISDNPQSVITDVERIRRHPLVPKDIAVHGFMYDVRTGKLSAVRGE